MYLARKSLDSAASVACLWKKADAAHGYSTGVSLHGHTWHSSEWLDFVPRALDKVPFAGRVLDEVSERRRRECGLPVSFQRAFWRPPLHAHAAYELEAAQIREKLGLKPIVALSDHDNLEACADLHAIGITVPYALEWTVPYQGTVFHLGIFNLPPEEAHAMAAAMTLYTAQPTPELLRELLAEIDALPDTLIVLNHPLCCELLLERSVHAALLQQFLKLHGARMHALELNGLQPASDNREVVRIAAEVGLPVISGGDRHCLEPNANVNLTNATSFPEFVNEIRSDRISRVLFMPQYRDAIATRYIEFISQAVRTYPELTGRQRWTDRVFYEHESKGLLSMSEIWQEGVPIPIRGIVSVFGFVATRRATLRMAFGQQGEIGA
ncbi:MAG TPA: hypothetical protein VMT86_03560 [Bryobacteraceae bacterium]|nr:hypothetical protein [Bryobacteraceae bacterium]